MTKRILSTILLLGCFAAAASAQTKADQAAGEARDKFFDVKNRSIEIERIKREANKQTVSESFTLNFSQIKEDFERIQKINDDFLKLTAVEKPLDDSIALKLAQEINRRAARLNANLFPADSARKKPVKNKQPDDNGEPPHQKKLLAALDAAINRFVHSPLFQNINLVNPDDSLAAQKELETVIHISGALKTKPKN